MPKVDHTKNIVEFEGISFSYGNEPALRDVGFAIHQGDYLGIVGPNGGGKTTLLKIMLGLLKPQTGTVRLFGQDIAEFKDFSKIGYVAQKAQHFDPQFPASVEEVVLMGRFGKRGLFKALADEDREKVQEALAKVGMEEFAHRQIGDLSGGQQQRVFIARALVSDPEMIILDEPTAGVDAKHQKEFYGLLRDLNRKEDLTLVLVTHDGSILEKEATEIATVNCTVDYQVNYDHA